MLVNLYLTHCPFVYMDPFIFYSQGIISFVTIKKPKQISAMNESYQSSLHLSAQDEPEEPPVQESESPHTHQHFLCVWARERARERGWVLLFIMYVFYLDR